jgi:hypothetical protein
MSCQAGEEREKSKIACFPLATKNYTRDSPRGSPWVVPQGHLGAAWYTPGVPLESPGGSPLVQPQGSQEQSPGAAWSSILYAPGLAWPAVPGLSPGQYLTCPAASPAAGLVYSCAAKPILQI